MNHSNNDSSIPYASVVADLWREGLERQGGIWLRVVSPSMYPLIGIGDWVWVESITAKSIKIGDILVFFRDKQMCVHRILRVFPDRTTFIEKGDFNTQSEMIRMTEMIGKVTRVKKRDGEIDFTNRYWSWVNWGLTLRSRFHKFWHEKIREKVKKIIRWLPKWLRNGLIRTYEGVKRLISPSYQKPIASAPSWKQHLERIRIGGQELFVHIPPGEKEMAEGYQGTLEIPENQGMLFIFGDELFLSFHSRNTTVPLSIAFINKKNEIIEIIDLPPFSDLLTSSRPAAFALEVNQNWFIAHSVTSGAKLEIEGF